MFLKVCLITSVLFSVSCIQSYNPYLNQQQEDKVFPIKDIINLKCRIKTGGQKEKKVPFTNALSSFNLEIKKDKSYKEAKEEPVIFKYKDLTDEKTKTGWINNLGYVPIKKVNRAGPLLSGSKVKCINLIKEEIHPRLRARSHHTYDVRFQVIGRFVRVLLLAPFKDIPSSALPYSLKVNETLYAMPIGGYAAQPVDVDPRQNQDREDTNVLFARPRPLGKHKGYENLTVNGILHIYPKGAKDIQVTNSTFQPYQSLVEHSKKIDVYPKGFFEGEWFYAVTPVQGSSTGGGFGAGTSQHYLSRDSGGFIAQTIRFDFQHTYLVAYNTNKEESQKPENEVRSTDPDRWVLRIPMTPRDYSSKQIGKDPNAGLQEVIDERKSWFLRPLAGLNFNATEMAIQSKLIKYYSRSRISSNFKNTSYLLDELTFSSDYFSFLIKDQTKNHSLRFSFLRKQEKENSSYVPIYISREMLNLFPPFLSRWRIPVEDHILKSENYQKRFPVNRFNIKEPIRYYFSELTPKEEDYPYVHTLARESINIWNQVFEKASVPCPKEGCFLLEEKTVPLGDIRYNVFNFIDPRETTGFISYGGLGPSMSDYKTGEIISATLNVNTLGFRRGLVYYIYTHIQRKTNMVIPLDKILNGIVRNPQNREVFLNQRFLLPTSFLYLWEEIRKGVGYSSSNPSGMTDIYGFQQSKEGLKPITSLEEALSENKKKELYLLYELITKEDPPQDIGQVMETVERRSHEEGLYHHCDLQEESAQELAGDRVYSLIDTLCGDSLSLLIPEMKKENNPVYRPPPHEQRQNLNLIVGRKEVKQEIFNCADKILPLFAMRTTLHELGHNISLRHQFKGSSDKENFLSNEDFSHDFIFSHLKKEEKKAALKLLQPESSSIMDYVVDPYIAPGAYDVAFVRFYYAGAGKTGKAESESGEILTVNFEGPIDTGPLKKYRVCDDTRVGPSIYNTDIFCNRYDKGTTPLEIVENYYNRYIDLPSEGFLNRALPRGGIDVIPFFLKTLKIYQKWRREIDDRLTKTEDPTNLSKTQLQQKAQLQAHRQKIYNMIKLKDCEEFDANPEKALECLCTETSLAAEYNKDLRNLYCAREKFVSSLSEILFKLHDFYCEVKKAGRMEWIPFSEIHGELAGWDSFQKDVSSCFDVKEIFEKTGWKLLYERGYPLSSKVFSTNENNIQRDDELDYRGSLRARILAGVFLKMRFPLMKPGAPRVNFFESLESDVLVSLMDEMDIQDTIKQTLLERITKGIQTGKEQPIKKSESHYYNFKNENLLWRLLSHPLLSFTSQTNAIEGRQNFLFNLVLIISPSALLEKNWDRLNNIEKFFYSLVNKDVYFHDILPEPNATKEIKVPLIIKPKNLENPYTKSIFSALNDIALARSFEIFFENFEQFKNYQRFSIKENEGSSKQETGEEESQGSFTLLSEFEKSLTEDIDKKIIEPVSSFIFQTSSSHISQSLSFLLTYSLLSDYLVDGTKFNRTQINLGSPDFIKSKGVFFTDSVIETIQSGLVTEFILKKAFLKKCKEMNLDCPSFQLPESLFGLHHSREDLNPNLDPELRELLQREMRTHFIKSEEDGSKYFVNTASDLKVSSRQINFFKPYLEDLYLFIQNSAETCANILSAPTGESPAKSPPETLVETLPLTLPGDKMAGGLSGQPAECAILSEREFQDLVLTLFELEAFKPGYIDAKNEVNDALRSLLMKVFPPTEYKSEAITNINMVFSQASAIRKSVKKLDDMLKYFPNSRFLREIFFMSLSKESPGLMIHLMDTLNTFYKDLSVFIGFEDHSSIETNFSDFPILSDLAKKVPTLLSANYNRLHSFSQDIEIYMDKMAIKETNPFEEGQEDTKALFNASLEGMKTVVFAGMLNKLFENPSNKETASVEREGSFKILLQNRMTTEIHSQENLLFNALHPILSNREFEGN